MADDTDNDPDEGEYNTITPSQEDVVTGDDIEDDDEEPVVDIQADVEDIDADPEGMSDDQLRQLNSVLRDQQERISELAEQIALLSTRIAHSEPGIGVCSVCHGPVVLEQPEDDDTPHLIRCQQCGEVYHEY